MEKALIQKRGGHQRLANTIKADLKVIGGILDGGIAETLGNIAAISEQKRLLGLKRVLIATVMMEKHVHLLNTNEYILN